MRSRVQLAEVESLLEDERYEMAVVAAQVDIELQVRILVEMTEASASPVFVTLAATPAAVGASRAMATPNPRSDPRHVACRGSLRYELPVTGSGSALQ